MEKAAGGWMLRAERRRRGRRRRREKRRKRKRRKNISKSRSLVAGYA